MEWSGGEGTGVEGRGGEGRAGQGRVPDCLGGLSRVGMSSRSTRPWNGQPPSLLLTFRVDDFREAHNHQEAPLKRLFSRHVDLTSPAQNQIIAHVKGLCKVKENSKKNWDRAHPTHPLGAHPTHPSSNFFLKPITYMDRTLKS